MRLGDELRVPVRRRARPVAINPMSLRSDLSRYVDVVGAVDHKRMHACVRNCRLSFTDGTRPRPKPLPRGHGQTRHQANVLRHKYIKIF